MPSAVINVRSFCRAYARRMIEHRTPLVGGVSPGKGGETVEGVPVFGSMREAVVATDADCVLSALPRERALDGISATWTELARSVGK